jgi:hypothetical protein
MRIIWSLIAIIMLSGVVAPPTMAAAEKTLTAQDQKWFAARAANRKARESLYAGAAADRVERAKKASVVVQDVIAAAEKNRVPGQDAELSQMVDFIERLDATQVADLRAKIKALPAEPASVEDKISKAWARTYDAKSAALTKPTETLGQKALDLGVNDIAFDCLQQVLKFNPDHASLRKALNQTKVDGRYYGQKDMLMVKAGLRWHEKLGWIVAKDAARYDKGDYFDIQSKKWTTLTAVNELRSTAEQQWVIQTEHLEIRGTAKLEEIVEAANHLERFYAQIFANYSLFFSKGKNDVKLIFGLLDHPRLVLNLAKDPDAYKASLPEGSPAGFSDGMWVPRKGESYFYAGPLSVMFHEFTHQILHVFSAGNQAEVWLTEGVAVYTETPTYNGPDLVLGDITKSGHILSHLLRVLEGKALTLDKLMALNHKAWKNSIDPGAQYGAAGALAQFCMEANKRTYRSDYVEFVRDSYLGEAGNRTLWEYLGLSKDDFTSQYLIWEKEQTAHITQRDKK